MRARRWVGIAVLSTVVLGFGGASAPVEAQPERVLILGSTVENGANSEEAQRAAALGFAVDVVDDATWSAMTAAQFGSYRAIVLGDPDCGSTPPAAAEANRTTWTPQIDGNVIINGTDPVFHSSQGGKQMTDAGIAFATAAPGKTGLYVSLSCYYDHAPAGTPVVVLDQLGNFTVTTVSCYNDAHIVATHPALAGLTDESLSNWSCSVHEAFDAFPSSFTVLAIAEGASGVTYTAPDGTVGIPYILARGEGLAAGSISLGPVTATNPLGTPHTVTALVAPGGRPQAGVTVTFTVTGGPHAGTTGTGVTDANGNATFSYVGTIAGTDTIVASFNNGTTTQTSNNASKTWGEGAAPIPTVGPTLPATGSTSATLAPWAALASITGIALLLLAGRRARRT